MVYRYRSTQRRKRNPHFIARIRAIAPYPVQHRRQGFWFRSRPKAVTAAVRRRVQPAAEDPTTQN